MTKAALQVPTEPCNALNCNWEESLGIKPRRTHFAVVAGAVVVAASVVAAAAVAAVAGAVSVLGAEAAGAAAGGAAFCQVSRQPQIPHRSTMVAARVRCFFITSILRER
jgi:hypothetical protein